MQGKEAIGKEAIGNTNTRDKGNRNTRRLGLLNY